MSLSVEQWLKRLLAKYEGEQVYRRGNQNLYESVQSLVPVLDRYTDAYKRLLTQSRTPWSRLVVDIVAERIVIEGFSSPDVPDMSDLWGRFKTNGIDATQLQVHREALAIGTSYVSVWDEVPGSPKIAFESGMSVTHENEPGEADVVAAAMKIWHDSIQGRVFVNVYLDDVIAKFVMDSEVKSLTNFPGKLSDQEWVPVEDMANTYGAVTIVPFVTRPDWRGYGRSDLEDLSATIQRIETLTVNTLLAVELGAFRQKWATGIEIPEDDEGNAIEPFKAALDRLWISEDPDSKFGSFDNTDIRPYLSAISDAVGQLSAVSRIPTLYFNQSDLANPPSASSLEASETGLINKVRERQGQFGQSWEQVAGLVTRMTGGSSTAFFDTIWKDPRTRSDAQTIDAAVKLMSIQVPWETVMSYLGYTSTEIEVMKQLRAEDTFQRLLNTAVPAAPRIDPMTAQPVGAPADRNGAPAQQ